MKTIYAEEIQIEGRRSVLLIFRYDKEIVFRLKMIRGCLWSNELIGWLLPWEENYQSRLERRMGMGIRIVGFERLGAVLSQHSIKKELVLAALKEFIRHMITKRYSESSIRSYTEHIRNLFDFFPYKTPNEISNEDIVRYDFEIFMQGKRADTSRNQMVNAVKLFYSFVHNQHMDPDLIERPRLLRKLPVVLSKSEVEKILKSSTNLKHKTIFWLIYSAGLRVSEAVRMEVKDIDSKRMLIHIRSKSGTGSRQIGLSAKLLDLLKRYLKEYKPKVFLFEGPGREAYTVKSVQVAFQKIKNQTAIRKNATVHTLRHSFAAHLLEAGVDLKNIQIMLGHKNQKTTLIYKEVCSGKINKIRSPLESLNLN